MITIETLKEFGADVNEGLARCLNKEDFYLKMVNMGIADPRFVTLKDVLVSKDLDAAFEQAHALKGVVGNLALTPIYDPLAEMTEMLRAKKDADYVAMYAPIKEIRDKLVSEL